MKAVLVDTGFIVASLDRNEKMHSACLEIMKEISVPLVTCEGVVAESCYLLRRFPKAIDALLQNIVSGYFQIPFALSESALSIKNLMEKYHSVPMDFADACLVRLAELIQVGDILTLGKDFEIYRWLETKRFNNLFGF